jgi:hypothetical protein
VSLAQSTNFPPLKSHGSEGPTFLFSCSMTLSHLLENHLECTNEIAASVLE